MYPFIEGQNGFSRTLIDEQWLTLGKTLRQVHEINVPSSIQHRVRREAYSPKWREIVRSLYTSIEAEPIDDERELLTHAGKISHQQAIEKAHAEYDKYRALTVDEPSTVERHFVEAVQAMKKLEAQNKK